MSTPDRSATRDPFAQAEESAASSAQVTGLDGHDALVVLGTGLGDAAHALGGEPSRHPLRALAGLPEAFVPHQRSEVWSVRVGELRVLVFLGRLHLYEGYSATEVAHLVRTAAAAGCRSALVTNASGAVDPSLSPGEIVLISDHLNLTGVSPLTGQTSHMGAARPSPFVDLVDAWSPRLRALAQRSDQHLREGVYAQLPGPHFETPAEIRMLRTLGADLVGMSSVLEAIAARQLGMELFGASLVTNMAAGVVPGGVSSEEIVDQAEARAVAVGTLLRLVLDSL